MRSYKDLGILILRLGIGLPFALIYGLPKIEGGPEFWGMIGGSMSLLGISFAPAFWGFMAAASEFAGGLLIAFGLFTRTTAAFLIFTMFIATLQHLSMVDQWYNVITPVHMLSVFLTLLLIGAGRYSLDYLFFGKKKEVVREND